MSGHSKWATIKRQKSATDIKRGLAFTKLANAIIVAVKKSGGITDLNSNFKLRLAVDAAKSHNMPKETIDRAIQRAVGKDSEAVEEVIYEGFAPNGVSVIVEAATDNPQRTSSEIKNIFNKEGGSFGQLGSVSYQFKQVGQIVVKKENKTYDEIFEQAVEAGAEDIEDAGSEIVIYTNYEKATKMKDFLVEKSFKISDFDVVYKPIMFVTLSDREQIEKTTSFLEKLESLDDVQRVYSNLDVSQ